MNEIKKCERHGINYVRRGFCWQCEEEVRDSGRYQKWLEAQLDELDYERGPSQKAFDAQARRFILSEA